MLNLRSAKITGSPGESGWAQVHEFLPDEIDKKELRGHLFAVIATTRVEGGVEIIASGRELISRLHEEYFGEITQNPFKALTAAIEKVFSEFKEGWGDVQIATCAVIGDVVFSAAVGGAKIVISRNGALATILDSQDEKVISASGYPKEGDVMLLGTDTFFKDLSTGVIKSGLATRDPDMAAEEFAPSIHTVGNKSTLGAVIIGFGQTPKTEIKPIASVTKKTYAEAKNYMGSLFSRLTKRLPERKIFVKEAMQDEVVSQNKKMTFTVALVLLVILAVSVGFGIRQKRINDVKKQYQGILTQAQENVDTAISLASVSPDKSRELFADSILKLEEIDALNTNVKDPKVEELRKKIGESRAAILGEYESAPELFLDLSLLSSGFKGDALSVSGGSVYILDKSGKRVVSIVVSTKKSKVVAGPGVIDEALDLAAYEDRAFVLTGDGIYETGTSKEKVIDKTWDGDAFIKAFAGNMYVLDKSGNAIYRYSGSGGGFGERQDWLASSTKADFSDAKTWSIDGAMYVLYPNSRILKYSLGSPQSFKLSGVIPEIGTVDAVYADPDNQYIYLLDKAGKRVVVTDKSGLYKAQYVNEEIGNAENLVVSESERKIILLTGDKLLSLEIKHL